MVRNYRRTTTRQSWAAATMQSAIESVERGMPMRTAARQFNIPRNTLKRRVLQRNKHLCGYQKGLGHSQCLPGELEDELVRYLKDMEARLFGLSKSEVCKMAYDLAERNGVKHPFNRELKKAGDDWFQSFLDRHPDLSLRVPEATSAARAQGFNRPVVSKFFEVLDDAITSNNITPERIYNCDETGIQTSHKPGKIIATKGRKQVGSLTSCDRGVNTTAVVAMSATGNFIPPMLIFARKRFKAELMDDTPAGTIGVCRQKGWMDSELFIDFLKHFTRYTCCSPSNKVLLLLDGHCSHKTLEAVEYCRANGIILLCFPAHCTHRMQPLDVGFFAPVMTYYNQEVSLWLKNHPGRIVTQFQVAGLFCKAFQRAASVLTATNAFQSTGIVPFNPNIFPDHLFAPCETTDRPPPASCAELNVTQAAVLTAELSSPAAASSREGADMLGLPSVPEPAAIADDPCTVSAHPASSPALEPEPTEPIVTADHGNLLLQTSTANDPCTVSTVAQPTSSPAQQPESTEPIMSADHDDVSLQTSTYGQSGTPEGHVASTFYGTKRPHISPYDISPLPTAERSTTEKPKRRRLTATLLTGSPFLLELKNAAKAKNETLNRKKVQKSLFPKVRLQKVSKTTKKPEIKKVQKGARAKPKHGERKAESSNNESQQQKSQIKKNKTGTRAKNEKKKGDNSMNKYEKQNYYCIYCSELFIDPPTETWLGCDACKEWAHQACADVSDSQRFVCDLCK